MFVWEAGQGAVVLLLHGAPSASHELRPLAHALASHHRVLVPDLPGYGSTPVASVRDLDSERDALVAMLRELGVTRLHAAIGYSLGAYRALHLALETEVRVERLGLLAGFGELPEPHREALRALSATLREQPAFDEAMYSLFAERVVSKAWRDDHPEIEAELRSALDNTTPAAFSAELLAIAESRSLLSAATRFEGPSAIRVGELDVMMPPVYSTALGHALRSAPTIVPNAGHALLIEDASPSIRAMLDLVRS